MINAVIVEDEPLAAKFLESLLVRTGLVKVVGTAPNGDWALTICAEAAPDAVFLDVFMPGRDGVEIAAELSRLAKPPLIVFTTGHADRACEAFRLRAVDYLVKPLQYSQVWEAVCRLKDMIAPAEEEAPTSPERSGLPCALAERLPVKNLADDVVMLISRWEIMAVVCHDRRTWVHTASGEYPTYYTLSDLANWLGDPPFTRISRESVVNLQAVEEVVHYGDRLYQVRIRDRLGSCLEASRSGSAQLATLIKPPV